MANEDAKQVPIQGKEREISEALPHPIVDIGIERIPRQRPEALPGERESFPIRHLYLDDLQAIHMTLGRYSNEIRYETEEFRFRVPTQLAQVPQDKIGKLHIITENPRVTITCTPGRFVLSTFSDDETSKAIYYEIWPLLNRRKSALVKYRDSKWASLLFSVAAVAISLAFFWALPDNLIGKVVTWFSFGLAILSMTILPFVLIFWVGSPDVVAPYAKRDKPRSWYLSDSMKIALVSIILTAIFTALITYFLTENK